MKKMKKMKKIVFLLAALTITIISCKNESKDSDVIVVPTIENKSDMKVTLDLIVKKNDSMQLFYIESEDGFYEEGNSVWA